MKFRELLNEIGTTIKRPMSIDMSFSNKFGVRMYKFNQDDWDYEVAVDPYYKSKTPDVNLRVDFWAKPKDEYRKELSNKMTGANIPLKILSYVTGIVEKYLKVDLQNDVYKHRYYPMTNSDGTPVKIKKENIPIMLRKITLVAKKEFKGDARRLKIYEKFAKTLIEKMGYKVNSVKKFGTKDTVGLSFIMKPVQIATYYKRKRV